MTTLTSQQQLAFESEVTRLTQSTGKPRQQVIEYLVNQGKTADKF